MGIERHYIQKQRVRVSAGSEAIAIALQSRLPDVQRTVLLETIERVLDEYSNPTQHIRIDRLSLDLGTIPIGRDFTQVVSARLERELRRALDAAVREATLHSSFDRYAQSPEEARLDLIEEYLTQGTLPFWTGATDFNAEAVVLAAVAATPDALVRLLRRHRDDPWLVSRLVRQLGDATLAQLLALLAGDDGGRVADETALRGMRGEIRTVSDALVGDAQGDRRASIWVSALTAAVHGPGGAFEASIPDRSLQVSDHAALAREHGASTPAVAEAIEWPYDLADALRYYLRYGVLPWTAALSSTAGRPGLTIDALLDSLPELPLRLKRTIFPAAAADRFAAVAQAVEQMSLQTRARLLVALAAEAGNSVSAVDAADPGSVPATARAIVRMLDSGGERWIDTDDSSGTSSANAPAPPPWEVHWVKSVLAARAKRGVRAGPADTPTATLLQFLIEEYPADASHFLGALRTAGLSPDPLLSELVSHGIFESSLMLLPARARAVTNVLLRLVHGLPSHERPGDADAIRAAAMAGIIDHLGVVGQTGSGEVRVVAEVLRALFGTTLPAGTADRLVADAERLLREGECAAEHLAALREVLQPFEGGATVDERQVYGRVRSGRTLADALERLPPVVARRVTQLVSLVLGWPAGDRPASDETIRTRVGWAVEQYSSADPLGVAFTAAVLRALLGPHTPAPTVGRLLADVERVAHRGEFTSTDVGVVRDAVSSLTPDPSGDSIAHIGEPGRDAVASFRRLRGSANVGHAELPDTGHSELQAATPPADGSGTTEPALPLSIEGDTGTDGRGSPPRGDARVPSVAARSAQHPEAAALARLRGPDHAEADPGSRGERGAPSLDSDLTAEQKRVPDRGRLSDDALRHVLMELAERAADTVREVLHDGLADQRVRDRWVVSLTEPELARVAYLLEPTHHRTLISSAESLFSAWDAAGSRPSNAASARTAVWTFMLGFLSRHAAGERSMEVLVHDFFAHIAVHGLGQPALSGDHGDALGRVFVQAVGLARRTGLADLHAVLSENRAQLIALATAETGLQAPARSRLPLLEPGASASIASPAAPLPSAAPDRAARPASPTRTQIPRRRMAFGMKEEPGGAGDAIHIANAGLVIVGAFLPQLFTRLDVLDEAPTGRTRVRIDAITRAVHLLQYLVDGRTDTPEPMLCLNKVLCGVPLAVPVDPRIDITAHERELCDSMLRAVIENWAIIKSTSIAGLRETFLQREGRLERPPSAWRLRVQRRTVDVLLDHLPWPMSTLAHSWMPEPLFVTW